MNCSTLCNGADKYKSIRVHKYTEASKNPNGSIIENRWCDLTRNCLGNIPLKRSGKKSHDKWDNTKPKQSVMSLKEGGMSLKKGKSLEELSLHFFVCV